jgi:hypothetical protein
MEKLIKILQILNKYHVVIGAEHDIILFWSPLTDMDVQNEDLEQLKELGLFYSEDYQCLAYFV